MAVNELWQRPQRLHHRSALFSFENSRILYRAILWASHSEERTAQVVFLTTIMWRFTPYVKNGKYCVVNNTYEPQSTTVYTDKDSFSLDLAANEIRWYEI